MFKQQTLTGLFSKKSEKKVLQFPSPIVLNEVKTTLTHEDPKVQEYYNQLTPQQVVAHTIAFTHLGTSYDVTRTHGFMKFMLKK